MIGLPASAAIGRRRTDDLLRSRKGERAGTRTVAPASPLDTGGLAPLYGATYVTLSVTMSSMGHGVGSSIVLSGHWP
jgi:hypothetical protein